MNEYLSQLAVEAAKGDSLLQSVTEIAQRERLNQEAIKRLVESTNQLAYLAKLDQADDRTFEFDVVKVEDVINSLFGKDMQKEASHKVDVKSILATPMEKKASEEQAAPMSATYSQVQNAERMLDGYRTDKDIAMTKIAHLVPAVMGDDKLDAKLAFMQNDSLNSFMKKEAGETREIFDEKSLENLKYISDNLEKLASLDKSIADAQAFIDENRAIMKQAFIAPAMASARTMASKHLSKPVKNKISSMAKGRVGKVYQAAESVGAANEVNNINSHKYNPWKDLRG